MNFDASKKIHISEKLSMEIPLYSKLVNSRNLQSSQMWEEETIVIDGNTSHHSYLSPHSLKFYFSKQREKVEWKNWQRKRKRKESERVEWEVWK